MKTIFVISTTAALLLLNPVVAIIYLAAIMAIAAAWYSARAIAWLLTPKTTKHAQIAPDEIGYEGLNHIIATPRGQNQSTVFYGSKHAVSDKPYQHQNGQTGPPEA